jgi:hypothetical protein
MLLENRNSVLEQELKNMGLTRADEGNIHTQVFFTIISTKTLPHVTLLVRRD